MDIEYFFKTMSSPVGKLTLVASDTGLNAILWEDDDPKRISVGLGTEQVNHPILLETEKQLNEYFEKKRKTFSIDLEFVGTEFQKQVWQALLTIPFGKTKTYGEIAQQIGNPQSVRAVGGAANRNPISIIAPCHRVVGASGDMVGFAGGVYNKKLLLEIEGAPKQLTIW